VLAIAWFCYDVIGIADLLDITLENCIGSSSLGVLEFLKTTALGWSGLLSVGWTALPLTSGWFRWIISVFGGSFCASLTRPGSDVTCRYHLNTCEKISPASWFHRTSNCDTSWSGLISVVLVQLHSTRLHTTASSEEGRDTEHLNFIIIIT
jgi:hypothetical protein